MRYVLKALGGKYVRKGDSVNLWYPTIGITKETLKFNTFGEVLEFAMNFGKTHWPTGYTLVKIEEVREPKWKEVDSWS